VCACNEAAACLRPACATRPAAVKAGLTCGARSLRAAAAAAAAAALDREQQTMAHLRAFPCGARVATSPSNSS